MAQQSLRRRSLPHRIGHALQPVLCLRHQLVDTGSRWGDSAQELTDNAEGVRRQTFRALGTLGM